MQLDAWFTHCDFDRSAAMSREEFIKAITNLHEFCAKPQLPKQYDSYDQLRTDWLRSTRVEYERWAILDAVNTICAHVISA